MDALFVLPAVEAVQAVFIWFLSFFFVSRAEHHATGPALTSLQGHAIRHDLDALGEDAHVPVNSTSFVGTMTYPCVHCDALKFHAELDTNSCCLNGQLAVLPVLPLPPLRLQQLFFGSSPRAVFFREHIRLFNSAMAFASMGVSEVKLGRGIPALRVHCSTYHLMGPLGGANAQPARYAVFL